jgi:site-specific DNA-methyltransferase (adenine-specific)/modification methylase
VGITTAKRTEVIGDATLYLGDCLEIMAEMEAGSVDAVVTDPPYGIAYNQEAVPQSKHIFHHGRQTASIQNDAGPFDPTPLLAYKAAILWGANCYASRLPDRPTWLVWDKVTRNGLALRIAESELAWTNCIQRSRVFRHLWSGAYRESENGETYHPTQKPVALMAWCLSLIPRYRRILDPFMGSGTTGVACMNLGRRFVGIEIEPKYFDIACKRIDLAARQEKLPLAE